MIKLTIRERLAHIWQAAKTTEKPDPNTYTEWRAQRIQKEHAAFGLLSFPARSYIELCEATPYTDPMPAGIQNVVNEIMSLPTRPQVLVMLRLGRTRACFLKDPAVAGFLFFAGPRFKAWAELEDEAWRALKGVAPATQT